MTDRRPIDPIADHSLPALTGLRGLSALWVLLYHAWVYATPQAITINMFGEEIRAHVFLSLGWAGVQIFFILSAFLLTTPYARANAGLGPRPSVVKFLVRRFARVFPAYYTQLSILALLAWIVSDLMIVSLQQLPYYLGMLFVPPPVGVGSPASINGVWWTLPIELSFYLILPVIACLASWRYKWLLLVFSLLYTMAWRFYVLDVINPTQKPLWVVQLPGSMDSFGLGMLGAIIHVQYTQVKARSAMYSKVLSALLLLTPLLFFGLGHWMAEAYTSYWSVSPIMFLWTPIFNFAVIILILNCANNQVSLVRLLGNRYVFYLGTVSYGLYLWHAPAGKWLQQLPWIAGMDGYQFPPLALGMLVLSLLAASLSWYLVEKRSIVLARKLG